MNQELKNKAEEWQYAIRETAKQMADNFIKESPIDEVIATILLNDDYSDRSGADWDTYFRKEFGLKALFCGSAVNKLPPTWHEAYNLAEEIYKKLPNNYDEVVDDNVIDKEKYSFLQRDETAFFDDYRVSLGTVIRVDILTQREKGTLIYWNKGFKKLAGGFGNVSSGQIAKIFVLNCIPEVEDEKLENYPIGSINFVSLIG